MPDSYKVVQGCWNCTHSYHLYDEEISCLFSCPPELLPRLYGEVVKTRADHDAWKVTEEQFYQFMGGTRVDFCGICDEYGAIEEEAVEA